MDTMDMGGRVEGVRGARDRRTGTRVDMHGVHALQWVRCCVELRAAVDIVTLLCSVLLLWWCRMAGSTTATSRETHRFSGSATHHMS